MSFAWINGSFVEEDSASVTLRDAGLLHGAGVFTTLRAAAGRGLWLDRHLARLRGSCEALFIPLPIGDAELTAATNELLDRNALKEARIRITVTRGAVSQDPLHGVRVQPNVFVTAAELQPYPAEYYQRGLTVILLDEQKLNPYDVQAGHKTLDYFSRLSALREANRRGAGEALWFNVHNYLQSGSISNVFVVREGRLITPPTTEEIRDPAVARATPYLRGNVLPGVVRGLLLESAQSLDLETRTESLDVNTLLEADEIFLTNSIMGVMPVCRVERKPIGDDQPGPVTRKLSALFDNLVVGWAT